MLRAENSRRFFLGEWSDSIHSHKKLVSTSKYLRSKTVHKNPTFSVRENNVLSDFSSLHRLAGDYPRAG
jgi:hypothetical protein